MCVCVYISLFPYLHYTLFFDLLLQCGDHTLWESTQSAFFERRRQSHPFLLILHAIIKNKMMDLVAVSDLSKWRETLALLSTYGKNEVQYSAPKCYSILS